MNALSNIITYEQSTLFHAQQMEHNVKEIPKACARSIQVMLPIAMR